ncbi:MAG: hypothetical protein GX025_00180 [Clostridiales bacterium]|nr:hypothetical protein [Clostridiales bacterium]
MITKTFLHNKTTSKRILALCLAFVLSFLLLATGVSAVSQQELDALKAKQSSLARQKSEVQAQANALQNELDAKTQQLDLLSQEIELTVQEIDTLTQLIATYTSAVAQMEDELAKSRLEEKRAIEHFHTRVRAMEENGSVSYISILFKASSFTDLLSRINCIEEISRHDSELIDNVRAAQKLVEENKAATEAQIAVQQEAVEEYQEKQTELLAQQAEVEAVLASLSADSAEYQQQLEAIASMQATLNGQVSNMTTALEELKRLQAEQDAMQNINPSTPSTGTGNTGGNGGSGSSGGSAWYGDGTSTASGVDIVNYAQGFLGVPYVYGGTSPSGFDCSGLVYYCYTNFGYSVYRTAATLAYNGTAVSKDNLQAGDVILFTSSSGGYIGHCGIYVGGGQFIHAPRTGDVVKFSSLSESYYSQHFYGARRIV